MYVQTKLQFRSKFQHIFKFIWSRSTFMDTNFHLTQYCAYLSYSTETFKTGSIDYTKLEIFKNYEIFNIETDQVSLPPKIST